MTTQPNEDQGHDLSVLDELLQYDGESGKRALTDWEVGFLCNLDKIRDLTFSPKRSATLIDIYRKVIP